MADTFGISASGGSLDGVGLPRVLVMRARTRHPTPLPPAAKIPDGRAERPPAAAPAAPRGIDYSPEHARARASFQSAGIAVAAVGTALLWASAALMDESIRSGHGGGLVPLLFSLATICIGVSAGAQGGRGVFDASLRDTSLREASIPPPIRKPAPPSAKTPLQPGETAPSVFLR